MKTTIPQFGLARSRESPAPGKHFYQFYKDRDDFFSRATPFLYEGLEKREACLWVVSLALGTLEALKAFQRQYEVLPFMETSQLLILPAEGWYLERGRFSERKALERFKKFVQEKERRGFRNFRFVGDLAWLEDRHWDRMKAWEEKLDAWVQTKNFTAVCAYPIYHCSLGQTKAVLERHTGVFPKRS